MSWKESKQAHKWCIDISSGLRLLIKRPWIREGICSIGRPTNNSSNQYIWVWVWAEEILRSSFASDSGWMGRNWRNRASSMVYPLRVVCTISNHVGHSQRVIPKNVVHLVINESNIYHSHSRVWIIVIRITLPTLWTIGNTSSISRVDVILFLLEWVQLHKSTKSSR